MDNQKAGQEWGAARLLTRDQWSKILPRDLGLEHITYEGQEPGEWCAQLAQAVGPSRVREGILRFLSDPSEVDDLPPPGWAPPAEDVSTVREWMSEVVGQGAWLEVCREGGFPAWSLIFYIRGHVDDEATRREVLAYALAHPRRWGRLAALAGVTP